MFHKPDHKSLLDKHVKIQKAQAEEIHGQYIILFGQKKWNQVNISTRADF